jgi:molecular chaperone GrpE
MEEKGVVMKNKGDNKKDIAAKSGANKASCDSLEIESQGKDDLVKQLKSQLRDKDEQIQKIKLELEKAETLKKEGQGRYLRSLAEADNLRKRYEKEKKSLELYSLEDMFKSILPVIDSMDTALKDKSITSEQMKTPLGSGFILVIKQLKDFLSKQGVKVIDAKGETFDPNKHQAMFKEESSEVKEVVVKDDLIKGYSLHDRVIRPSMVIVLIPKEKMK